MSQRWSETQVGKNAKNITQDCSSGKQLIYVVDWLMTASPYFILQDVQLHAHCWALSMTSCDHILSDYFELFACLREGCVGINDIFTVSLPLF